MLKDFAPVYYERCDCTEDNEPHYQGEDGLKVWYADDLAYQKRLGDTEIMAEFWRQEIRAMAETGMEVATDALGYEVIPLEFAVFGPLTKECARRQDMMRFMELPHFQDEPNWQDDPD